MGKGSGGGGTPGRRGSQTGRAGIPQSVWDTPTPALVRRREWLDRREAGARRIANRFIERQERALSAEYYDRTAAGRRLRAIGAMSNRQNRFTNERDAINYVLASRGVRR